jgi:hypothetical protein
MLVGINVYKIRVKGIQIRVKMIHVRVKMYWIRVNHDSVGERKVEFKVN